MSERTAEKRAREEGRAVKWLLRRFGFVKIDYGFSCGRHWVSIDGKVLAQTAGDSVPLDDGDVCRIARACIPGCIWGPPFGQCERCGAKIEGEGVCGDYCKDLVERERRARRVTG